MPKFLMFSVLFLTLTQYYRIFNIGHLQMFGHNMKIITDQKQYVYSAPQFKI